MTTEEKFNAAVNVIRNLPKNGAYQPSHDLKLKFYGFFKQATDGPCSSPKPAFWDVIGRSKYFAWKKLGNMSKIEAMENYVEELKKIVETMSYNDNVGVFLGSLDNFYENVPAEDIEMLLGPVIKKVKAQPGNPPQNTVLDFQEAPLSRESSSLLDKTNTSSVEISPASSISPSLQSQDTDDENEEFIDTEETTSHLCRKAIRNEESSARNTEFLKTNSLGEDTGDEGLEMQIINHPNHIKPKNVHSIALKNAKICEMNGKLPNINPKDDIQSLCRNKPRDRENFSTAKRKVVKLNGSRSSYAVDLSQPLREAVIHLQKDLDKITSRIRSLEISMFSDSQCFEEVELCKDCDEKLEAKIGEFGETIQKPILSSVEISSHRNHSVFPDISRTTLVFIIVWPFIAHFFIKFFQMKRNNKCKSKFTNKKI